MLIKSAARFSLRAMCFATVALGAVQAHAQDTGSDATALDEVVVTARRTTERVQDVPVTVNVISGQALEDKGVTTLSNISSLAPNLVWSDGGGTYNNRVSLRGIFSGASAQGFEPGVAVYMDDVYLGNTFGFNMALLDIERIEVLKGPQGTLFGRNAAAGAIAVFTKRPTTDDFHADANVRIGNYGLVETRGVVNMPLGDKAALKVSGIYRDREGYQTNVATGNNDLNDEHFYGGRLQLLVTPTEDIDLVGTVEYFRNDDHQDINSCQTIPGSISCPNATRDAVFGDLAGDSGTYTERTMWATSLHGTWRAPGGYTFTSISAYRSIEVHGDVDQDYSVLNYVRSGYHVPEDTQFTQEFRVSTPQEARLRGVGGVYYYYEDRTANLPLTLTSAAISFFTGGAVNLAQDFVQTTNAQLKSSSWAVFGQGQYDITDRLTAELGLRYTEETKDFTYEQIESANLLQVPGSLRNAFYFVAFPKGSTEASYSKLTSTMSLSYRFSEDALVFARYSRGFKAGGFQSATNSLDYNPLVPFNPENSEQWEAGLKSEWFERRLRFNASVFTTNYTDIQVQITDPVTKQKFVGNFGAVDAKGAEFEVVVRPFAGFTVDGNLGLQHSKFVSGSFQGRSFQYIPHATASLGATWRRPVFEGWTGVATANASYRSAMNLNTNAPTSANFLATPPVTYVNARLGLERDDGRWGVFLWGANLGDSRRFTNFTPGSAPTPAGYKISPPRTYGVELKARF